MEKPSNKKMRKTALSVIAGVGAGSLLFVPWSISRSANVEKEENSEEITENTEADIIKDLTDFEQTFADARAELGAGNYFEFNGRLYSTYYEDEWDNMSIEEKQEFLSTVSQIETELQMPHSVPIASYVTDDMSLEDAVCIAREVDGAGAVFEWRGKIYTSYTKEEINNMSPEEHEIYFSAISEKVNIPINSINDIEVTDFDIQDENFANNNRFNLADDDLENIIDDIGNEDNKTEICLDDDNDDKERTNEPNPDRDTPIFEQGDQNEHLAGNQDLSNDIDNNTDMSEWG